MASQTMQTMDILATIFFICAGVWLILAILYSASVLIFLQMRQRGELENITEPSFGRYYFCGGRFYIPLGWLFRQYMRHLSGHEPSAPVHVMTRRERRKAMEKLLRGSLVSASKLPAREVEEKGDEETGEVVEDDTFAGPLCSICLDSYEETDEVLQSPKCVHEFHKDCCLDWLERSGNVECPCCRVELVTEDQVWDTVRQQRKKTKKDKRKRKLDTERSNSNLDSVEDTERTLEETNHSEDASEAVVEV